MSKVDINRYDFVMRGDGIQLEDKQSHKVIGYIDYDQSYIKEKSELTFWDKFCTWTLGLFGLGNSWKKTVVFINSAGNAPKEYYIAKRSFPNLENLKPVESPRVYERPKAFTAPKRAEPTPQERAKEPSPKPKAESPKPLLTQEMINEKAGFYELRSLLSKTLNIPESCSEKELIEAIKAKRKDKTLDESSRSLLKGLQEKYLSATIPELFLSIDEIRNITSQDELEGFWSFSCELLGLHQTKDLEKIADAYVAKYEAIKDSNPLTGYYFKKLINKAASFLTTGLCLFLELNEDSSKEAIKKAYKKWIVKNHPDKQRFEDQKQKDEATALFQEMNSYYKAYETLSKAE